MHKQGVWVLWLGSITAMLVGRGWIATLGLCVFGLTFVAHVVEFLVHRELFQRAGGSMGHHFVQTMVYGMFHWSPIKERLESGGGSPPASA